MPLSRRASALQQIPRRYPVAVVFQPDVDLAPRRPDELGVHRPIGWLIERPAMRFS